MLERVGAILLLAQAGNPMESQILALFQMRQFSKTRCDHCDLMSHMRETRGDVRAGIARAATDGRVFTVDDQDFHETFQGDGFQGRDYGCVV